MDTPAADSYDASYARTIAGQMIDDIKTVDLRLKDGISVPSALYLLSDDYPRLTDLGVPPGLDAAKYKARLRTLGSFAQQAADEYDASRAEGSARYAIVRKETGVLLDSLNSALGSTFRLP